MKKFLLLAAFLTAAAGAYSYETGDEREFYASLTSSAEFNYAPAYVFEKHAPNTLYADLSVSIVGAVPFGFILSSAALYAVKASEQSRWNPEMGSFDDNKVYYTVSVLSFAVVSAVLNMILYY